MKKLKEKLYMCSVCLVVNSCLTFVTPWTLACQAPLSMGFLRQEYCSGLPFPSPGDLPDPRIEHVSPALAGRFFTTEPPGKPTEFQFEEDDKVLQIDGLMVARQYQYTKCH